MPSATQPQQVAEVKEAIRARALAVGFDVAGFAATTADPRDQAHLRQYLEEGRHGDMAWMATSADRRADPAALWPEARTAIVVGLNYGPATDPLAVTRQPGRAAISVYARGRDYHDVMKKRLKALGRWLVASYQCEVKVFVDTAPIMEKPLAMRAGLGWIGKHSNLVSRRFGSWLFLGEVLTTLNVPPDRPEVDHCGSCDRCREACPTAALPLPYRIEPRRCISYLTIEHKSAIPRDLGELMGNRVYGCDDCLAACPWNKFAPAADDRELDPRPELSGPPLAALADLDEIAFAALTRGTAIRRVGHDRFVRNTVHALANEGDHSADAIIRRLADNGPSGVREAARSCQPLTPAAANPND